MGETAEVLARQYGITRERVGRRSPSTASSKAEAAQKAGHFDAEIAPVAVTETRQDRDRSRADEHPRPGSTLEALAKLPLTFP